MDVNQIMQDPEFHALPKAEQAKVLREVDPEFTNLPPAEQNNVVLGLQPPQVSDPNQPVPLRMEAGDEISRVPSQDPNELSLIQYPNDKPRSESLMGYVGDTLSNIPSSTANLVKNMVQPILHPVDTAQAAVSVIKGAIDKGSSDIVRGFSSEPEAVSVSGDQQAYKAMTDALSQRYGGVDNLLETIRTDPAGFAADVSLLLTGAGGAAKVAGSIGNMSKIANVGSAVIKAGSAVDPVSIAAKIPGAVIRGAESIPKAGAVVTAAKNFAKESPAQALGTFTGVGTNNIIRALDGGEDFYKALRGNMSHDDIVTTVKGAAEDVRTNRRQAYVSALEEMSKNTDPLPFDGVTGAFEDSLRTFRIKRNADGSLSNKGSAVNNKHLADLQELDGLIAEWKADPSLHTPLGMDALKQRIDDFYSESSNVRALVSKLRNTVKSTIVDNVPDYAKMTGDYEQATKFLKELDKTLSISDKAQRDTTMRKLLSTGRDNFDFRKELLNRLEAETGRDIAGPVAGASLNAWKPRGLLGNSAAATTLGTSFYLNNPALLSLLALTSPRLMGETIGAAGGAIRGVNQARGAVGADNLSLLRNLAVQAGRNRNLQVKPELTEE